MYIDEHDVEQILELSARSDIYDHLISSVAPSIYGFEQKNSRWCYSCSPA